MSFHRFLPTSLALLLPCPVLLCSLLLCSLLLGSLYCTSRAQAADLQQYQYRQSTINVCRADPRNDAIAMYWKDGSGAPLGNFARLDLYLRQQGRRMLCATNAGIYDKQLQPLGLYIEQGQVLRPLNTRQNAYGNFYLQPNGVFVLGQDRAWIVQTSTWAEDAPRWTALARFATQSGPLMLIDGKINARFDPDSPNALVRNAVCLDPAGTVHLAIARNPISFYDFAAFLRDTLRCRDALYLDGSISRMLPSLEAHIGPDFGAMIAVLRK